METFDLPITRNPLRTRSDLAHGLLELLKPLARHSVGNGSGFHLGNSGTHYSPRVAAMEGFSRILWGITPLLAGGGTWPGLERHIDGLCRGTDPADPEYWGEAGDSDQRLVEMAAIALALMMAPEQFWDALSTIQQENLRIWLAQIEKRALPATNWHFFRILVCSAFRKLGLPVDAAAERESFDLVESLYRGDGWYQDGPGANYDFYNPFGFHFYGLVYARLMGDRDPERAARYVERARLFAPQFLAWFRDDGSVVPYGRSLCYRFGVVSFFSACAFAGVEVLPWPVMKGLVLRNLRWWFSRPILDAQGILSIGYGYPNLVMAEQYNSPTSPYWSLKTWLVLALGGDHPFWRAEEAPLPAIRVTMRLAVPQCVLSRSEEDVQLLCPGRYPPWESVHSAAKYCKFVYSARFGFCVSHGSYGLAMTGCDSSLVLSEGDGYWRERRVSSEQASGENWVSGCWKPWSDVRIDTILVSLGAWHLRIHRIRSARRLEAVEGGFSLSRFSGRGADVGVVAEGADRPFASIRYPWGESRIHNLSGERRGEIIHPEPNLNILYPSVALPALRGIVLPGETILICAVRAGDPAGPAEPIAGDSQGGARSRPAVPRVEMAPDGRNFSVYDAEGRPVPVSGAALPE